MMKDLFVPFEIAVLLKEKGFNEPCLAYYPINYSSRLSYTSLPYSNTNSYWVHNDCITAPTHEQVLNWFRKNHKLQIFLDYFYYDGFQYGYKWCKADGSFGEWWKDNEGDFPDGWETQEEAIVEAIKEALKII